MHTRFLLENLRVRDPVEDNMGTLEDNIKTYLQEKYESGWNVFIWLMIWSSNKLLCEIGNKSLDSIKGRGFLGQLSDCRLVKKDCACGRNHW
jgi:hypothetical protein